MTKKKQNGQEFGELWRGKAQNTLEWQGICFLFPYSQYLPGLSKAMQEGMRESFRTRGVRKPIDVLIPNGSNVRFAGERLTVVEGDQGDMPVVIVIDGEVRLRMAISNQTPLDEIPFRQYQRVEVELDEDFKALLKNQDERDSYDALPDDQRAHLRLLHDLWDTEAWRRGGKTADGRERMITLIDMIWDEKKWTRLSAKKMASLVGTSHTQVRRDRQSVGSKKNNELSAKQDKIRELDETRWRIAGVTDEVLFWAGDVDVSLEDLDGYKSVVAAVTDELAKQASQRRADVSAKIQQAYDDCVAQSMGGLSALFETTAKISALLDESTLNVVSDVRYDDLFVFDVDSDDAADATNDDETSTYVLDLGNDGEEAHVVVQVSKKNEST